MICIDIFTVSINLSMKKIVLISLVLTSLMATTYAQDNAAKPQTANPCAKFYLGPSVGVNNEAGLIGLNLDLPLDRISIGAGIGISSWGTKAFGEVKYFFKPCHRGWAVGVGLTHNSGLSQSTLNLETTNSTPNKENVTLNTNPETNAFLAAYRFWNVGKGKTRCYLELGWSVPFSTASYTVTSGQTLVPLSDQTVKAISPGGLIVAFGFSFGL